MAEITILKVKHGGIDPAKKLRPYIESVDVYCPEAAGHTKKAAYRTQQLWLSQLKKPKSRMLKERAPLYEKFGSLERDFALTRYDILHRNKKPILILERFTQKEARQIDENIAFYSTRFGKSVKRIQAGEVEEPIQIIRECVRRMRENSRRRDLMIARSLDNVVELAQEVFPDADDSLRVAVEIGAAHLIENYFVGDLNVEDFSGEIEPFYQMLTAQTQSPSPPTDQEVLALAEAKMALKI